MRVLLTGNRGYIGRIADGELLKAGFDVTGVDSGLFDGCDLPGVPSVSIQELTRDIRDLQAPDLRGFDAVVHLAALSNDPLGDLDPGLTYEINHEASVRLASFAREAGVSRFVFSSSCSVYGAAGDAELDEDAAVKPITPYAVSKVLTERDIRALATPGFSPVFLRNATAYGVSPRLRLDVVVNNLVGSAIATGRIHILSDGTPWRPLVHVRDICAAIVAVLRSPREAVHNRAFNIGMPGENYRVSDIAQEVARALPGCAVTYAEGGGPDPRCYRVDFSRAANELPGFAPEWTLSRGVDELAGALEAARFSQGDWDGDRYIRIRRLRAGLAYGRLDERLRRREPAISGVR